MIPLTFAPLVPNDVREWATGQTSKSGVNPVRQAVSDRIRRLVTYETDRSLWTPLIKLQESKTNLSILGLMQITATAPSEFQRLSKEPIHLIRSDATALATEAQRLARRLKSLMGKVSTQNRHALSLYSVAMVAAEGSDNPAHKVLIEDPELQMGLLDFERYAPELPELVSAMSLALKRVINDESGLRPRKMNAAAAERTFVIVTLKRYFHHAIGRVPNKLVAEIVNRVLARKDTTADTVRKTSA